MSEAIISAATVCFLAVLAFGAFVWAFSRTHPDVGEDIRSAIASLRRDQSEAFRRTAEVAIDLNAVRLQGAPDASILAKVAALESKVNSCAPAESLGELEVTQKRYVELFGEIKSVLAGHRSEIDGVAEECKRVCSALEGKVTALALAAGMKSERLST